ncbi:MAG: DUF493 family protein [Leeuwenhoekiella sp.]
MEKNKNPEEFYDKLRARLEETSSWPSEYLFKFIVTSDEQKIKQIEKIFDNMGAVIKTTASRTGKFTSVSINVRMKDPDHVIKKYKEVSVVDGVISL